MNDDRKEVRFDKYCKTCRHEKIKDSFNPDIGEYDGTKWTGADVKEEYIPCCICLETESRYGTEMPMKWEEK